MSRIEETIKECALPYPVLMTLWRFASAVAAFLIKSINAEVGRKLPNIYYGGEANDAFKHVVPSLLLIVFNPVYSWIQLILFSLVEFYF